MGVLVRRRYVGRMCRDSLIDGSASPLICFQRCAHVRSSGALRQPQRLCTFFVFDFCGGARVS